MEDFRKEFPVLVNNPNIAYLDSAASSLKPQCVIDKMNYYYEKLGVNVHRGVYELSYEATDLYEEARQIVADFLGVKFEEIVFTRGASASLNLVASSYGMDFIEEGDEVITTELEHHSSCMPWMNVCKKKKAVLKFVPLDSEGRITVEAFKSVLTNKTKVVAITHVSNVMGYLTPIKEIIDLAHSVGAIVTLDGAQSIPHMRVLPKELDCDFLSFSGHKMCGPSGIGVLYGKKKLLDKMNPIEFGGDMAQDVSKDEMTFKDTPYKFETGTPLIAEAIGLGEAIKFINKVGMDNIFDHEKELRAYAISKLEDIEGLTIYNKTAECGVIAMNIDGVHPHDAASVFDKNNVCIRAGHHCAQLITKWLNVISTIRASFYFYNTKEDVDKLVDSIKEAIDFFGQF